MVPKNKLAQITVNNYVSKLQNIAEKTHQPMI